MSGFFKNIEQIPIDPISLAGGDIDLLRLDLLDPDVSGNKWFKLKYNIQEVLDGKYTSVLTFGGAFSNHIAAVAALCRQVNIKSIGVIRGESHYSENPTLSKAIANGMELKFINRTEYRIKDYSYWSKLYPDSLIIPEGGSNSFGIKGASEICDHIPAKYDRVVLAVGTGGTMAGIISRSNEFEVVGFPVLKNARYLEKDIIQWSNNSTGKFSFNHDYHFGGYGKYNTELIEFMRDFYTTNGTKLDPIYTAKLLYGVSDLLSKGHLAGRNLVLHTGGLQGIKGVEYRTGKPIY